MTGVSAFAAAPHTATFKNWTVDPEGHVVQYTSHGHTVYGHQFGFVKMAKHCDDDILWVSWSTYKKGLKAYEGTQTSFRFQIGKTSFELPLPLLSTFNYTPDLTVASFTNFVVNDRFIALLERHTRIQLTIVGPKKLLKKFDIQKDSFGLAGLRQARARAKAMCEKL